MGGSTRMFKFSKQEQWQKARNNAVKKSLSESYDDAWATDKNWLKSFEGVFFCKFCAKEMYAADYKDGWITMSCRTPLCPGNIDHDAWLKHDFSKYDIREMTNQYLFNSLLKF